MVKAFDPAIGPRPGDPALDGIEVCADAYGACDGAAVLVVLTEWDDFRRVDLTKVAGLLVRPLRVVDARNLLDPAELRKHGLPVHRDRPLMAAGRSGRRVVVTGGAGFLGSHLCRALLARGDEVVAVDNLITGRRENLADLFGKPGFMFQHHDVSNFVHVPGPVDAVLHFASPASPIDYLEHPHPDPQGGQPGHPQHARRWPCTRAPATCWRRPARCTATPSCTPRPRTTGATSTPSAPGASTTRPSASPRP